MNEIRHILDKVTSETKAAPKMRESQSNWVGKALAFIQSKPEGVLFSELKATKNHRSLLDLLRLGLIRRVKEKPSGKDQYRYFANDRVVDNSARYEPFSPTLARSKIPKTQ